jgi:hypothetical protein
MQLLAYLKSWSPCREKGHGAFPLDSYRARNGLTVTDRPLDDRPGNENPVNPWASQLRGSHESICVIGQRVIPVLAQSYEITIKRPNFFGPLRDRRARQKGGYTQQGTSCASGQFGDGHE